MPAILPLLALELLFLLLTFSYDTALGNHFNCSWHIGEGSPRQYSYVPFCAANRSNSEFYCGQSIFPEKEGVRVATWGQFGKDVFEWISPCGDGGGYGLRDDGNCISDHWAICISIYAKDCFYMASGDDCQWPRKVARPVTIVVYYQYHVAVQQEVE